jgi:hypothetical protein
MAIIIKVEQEYRVVRTTYVIVDTNDVEEAKEAVDSGEIALPDFHSTAWVDNWHLIDERTEKSLEQDA